MATINDIPTDERKKLMSKVLDQLNSMSNDELEIATKTKHSLAKTIGLLFQEIAKLMGYIIAYPVLLVAKIVDSITQGFSDGIESAWNEMFGDK